MRHWIIEPFFPDAQARALAAAFANVPEAAWYAQHHRHSRKWSCRDFKVMPMTLANSLIRLNHAPMLMDLSERTGIKPLISDFMFYGGGLHQSRPGSFLDLHADFQAHPDIDARRALNLLIYLSPDWEPAWGGELELWDDRVRHRLAKIAPSFNRAVLFETTATSFHGHPDPMGGPEWARRNSLALYYYTPWKPGEQMLDALTTTDYRARPWEYRERVRKWGGRMLRRYGWK